MEDFVLPVYILGLFIFIIFWIWALLDLVSSTFKKTRWKIAWLLVIIFFPLFGSILYLLLRKDFKARRKQRFNRGFTSDNRAL